MAIPTLLPTGVRDETFGGVTYHIEGELVPVLHLQLSGVNVYFEHNILLWKDPMVDIGVRPMRGAFKRMVAGMPLFLTETRGVGNVAFSRDGAGHVFGLHMNPGTAIDCREHQWLAATDALDYSFTRIQGISNMLFGSSGLFIDTFIAGSQPGILWMHGYGNVFELVLQPGEVIDVEPGGWIYKDRSVGMETMVQRLATGFFASGGNFVFNRFTGPGRLAIQSMYYHMPTSE